MSIPPKRCLICTWMMRRLLGPLDGARIGLVGYSPGGL